MRPRMPRQIGELLTLYSNKFELSFLLTKEPKYKDKGGNGEAKCTFYSIRKKLSALALRFTLAFSEEAVWRNHLRLCLFPRDLVYYYQFGF